MSWNVSFTLSRDEEGKAVLTLGNEFGAPEGAYSVTGHTLAHDQDWGESIGVSTPQGYVGGSINNPRTRVTPEASTPSA